MNYLRSLVIGTRAIMPLLIIEFLLGMYANLFLTFPTGDLAFLLHVAVGTLLLALSLLILVLAGLTRNWGLLVLAVLGFASMNTAFMGGVLFVSTGYTNNAYSYLMAVGFILSLILFGTLTGRSMQAIHQQRPTPSSSKVAVAIKPREPREDSEW